MVLTQAETEAVAVKRRMMAEICMVVVWEDWMLMVLEMFRWWMVMRMEMHNGRNPSYQRRTSQY